MSRLDATTRPPSHGPAMTTADNGFHLRRWLGNPGQWHQPEQRPPPRAVRTERVGVHEQGDGDGRLQHVVVERRRTAVKGRGVTRIVVDTVSRARPRSLPQPGGAAAMRRAR